MELAWDPAERLTTIRCIPGAILQGTDADVMTAAIATWVGTSTEPFALLADVEGVQTTDAEFRGTARSFFSRYRERVFIAVLNMGPVIRVIAEMFRLGSGVQVRGFANEADARAWLRQHGVPA